MRKASGKTTMLLHFVISLYPKKDGKLEGEALDHTLWRTGFERGGL
jgi:hypothetical protein